MERPVHLGNNYLVCEHDGYMIRKYGCCGRYAYMVGDAVANRILKLPFMTFEEAENWIAHELQKKATFSK